MEKCDMGDFGFADLRPRSVWSVCLVCGVDDLTPLITSKPILLSSQGISEWLRVSIRDWKKGEQKRQIDGQMRWGESDDWERRRWKTETEREKSWQLWMPDWVLEEWTRIMKMNIITIMMMSLFSNQELYFLSVNQVHRQCVNQ